MARTPKDKLAQDRKYPNLNATNKHKREQFCQMMLIHNNGAKAARLAGYSEHSAKAIASELLTKPDIIDRLAELRTERAKSIDITAERLLRAMAMRAFPDRRKLYDEDGKLVSIADMDEETAAMIDGLELDPDGNPLKFKLNNPDAAQDKLARHLGLYRDNELQVTHTFTQMPVIKVKDNKGNEAALTFNVGSEPGGTDPADGEGEDE